MVSLGKLVWLYIDSYVTCLNFAGDLRDDTNPEFAKEFYQALSVVCDDLFFARYQQSSGAAQTLAQKENVGVDRAAEALLSAMYGEAYTEDEKHQLVEDLLDVRLLPATDVEVQFNRARIDER